MHDKAGLFIQRLAGGINILLSLLLIIESWFSLQWKIVHDSPILFYMGWLSTKLNFIPFRDFFDMNMPGAHWICGILGVVFGFNDPGYRRADILVLFVTLLLIFIWLKSFGILPAWTAAVVFGLTYLQYGPGMSLQREFLLLPFLLAAFIFIPGEDMTHRSTRVFVSGFFIGLVILIKPQFGLMAVPLFMTIWFFRLSKQKTIHAMLMLSIGIALPILGMLIYLWSQHALPEFIEVTTRYWPLYTAINGRLEINNPQSFFVSVFDGLKSFGLQFIWLITAGLSCILILKNEGLSKENKAKLGLLVGGILISYICVVIANKYWNYHWLPVLFFAILLSSIILSSNLNKFINILYLIPPLAYLIAIIILLRPAEEFQNQVQGQSIALPQGGRVQEISSYLINNLQPGDTVQPLDWSNGAVHAMLEARALPATRYLYDFHFYHHLSNPEIQYLRIDLIRQLNKVSPKIIIQFITDRPWVDGHDTTREFLELEQFLTKNYYIDENRNGYIIWQRQ
jgi:hypothetical protein